MKKFIKIIIISVFWLSFLLWNLSLWYVVETPDAKNDDIKVAGTVSVKKEAFKMTYLKITNKYVWVIWWAICLGIVVYAGIMLITSEWDEAEMKKANKTLIYWIVWIILALWAYVIINIILKLF